MNKVKNVIKGYCVRNDIKNLIIISDSAIAYSEDIKNYIHPCEIAYLFFSTCIMEIKLTS